MSGLTEDCGQRDRQIGDLGKELGQETRSGSQQGMETESVDGRELRSDEEPGGDGVAMQED